MADKISVIIPVYNVETTLRKCVDSVLAQTYPDIEIILSDDGSKDNSGAICDEYAAKYSEKIRVIHEKNGGLATARNRAMPYVTGKYMGFLDSDDWIVPDMYEYLYELMKKTDCTVSMCSFAREEKDLDYGTENEKITVYEGEREIREFFYRLHGEPSFYSVWNRLYKTEEVRDLRYPDGHINEDVYFTYLVYRQSKKLAVSSLKKHFYYKNPAGITRNGLRARDEDLLWIWDRITEMEKDTPYAEYAVLNRKRASYTLCAKALVYGKAKDVDPQKYAAWKKEVKENYKDLSAGDMIRGSRRILLWWIAKVSR
ncbi:MAG: glycosyltransferase family 2 protein [Erysipelotrichales bacterium]|nr:glycosyltransferase family 2 protein [Erysipelotrichales bacterium]